MPDPTAVVTIDNRIYRPVGFRVNSRGPAGHPRILTCEEYDEFTSGFGVTDGVVLYGLVSDFPIPPNPQLQPQAKD